MSAVYDSQFGGNRCADIILHLNECFEALGVTRGQRDCKMYQDDLLECRNWIKKEKAVREVHRIRTIKLLKGELKPEDVYLEPAPPNSFLYFPRHR